MSSLSNERLQKIASWREKYGNEHNVIIPAKEAELITRELLAYREAQDKAVAGFLITGMKGRYEQVADKYINDDDVVKLYAAPQLPAIPDEITPDDEQIMAIEGVTPPLDTGNSPVIPDGWISVGDRLPDHDELVLVWPTNDFGVESHTGQYLKHHKKGAGWFAQIDEQNYGIEFYPINVTHWMPLPAAPKPE